MPAFDPFPLPPNVWPIAGEPLRFYVASRTRLGLRLLVDLEECGFNGGCACENFQMKLLPLLKKDRDESRPPYNRRCWHIKQASRFLAELTTRGIARKTNAPKVYHPPKLFIAPASR